MIIESGSDMVKCIRELRLRNDLSVAELSELSGVSKNTIWRVETGKNTTVETAAMLLSAMGAKIAVA